MPPFRYFLLAGSLATALPAPAAANLLLNAAPASWGGAGSTPPKPWQHSDREADSVTVRTAEHQGSTWIEFRDESTEKAANLRQEFPPLKSGRISFRVALAKDHVGEFGLYLGQGNASAPVERVVELKTSTRGLLHLGSGGERAPTAVSLTAGMSDHLYLDFEPAGHDLVIRLGRLAPDGQATQLAESTFPQRAHPVTRLRITSDNLPRGSRFLVTDLALTPLP